MLYSVLAAFDKFRISACKKLLPVMAVVLAVWQALVYLSAFFWYSFANSEFVALLKQANTDSSKMAEVIGVSEAQLRFVTNTASGMGLIKCGSVVIPFDNQISKDTDLYRLYNTNIHELIEQKKKEARQ